ncbi:histone-like nucleoid-structuring protein MvaT [Denitrificimonas sp. JX-1]|uniref:Histone-like nucleoid-structuring protein MvaT n=1 Tax=Denitrificimonas halotolerans TaxID=3098930 RepID=A0ABU5GPW0_9GAMM|nr:histone-like nucleoid-structuring protein MvaT [Denitrificimonas sp. JX-1]MDY7218996.1 histone-like nucleoid-structuring protein MvaT [Denitrificimonas sp. JX-1]
MSLINEFRETKERIKELENRLANLSQDSQLQKELEFEEKLRALMAEYNKSLRDIIVIIDPQAARTNTPRPAARTRSPRKTKQYDNPHTGEVIRTKGGNHKVLKEWKAKWGSDVVESWVTIID